MKAVLLAAGRGTRIAEHIQEQHKCLLSITSPPIPPLPLIVYTVEMLQKYGIHDITVVTGYRHVDVETVLTPYPFVSCLFNPFYYLVNSIGSLWFATAHMSDADMLILNADTFMEEALIQGLLQQSISQSTPLLLVDSSRKDVADVGVRYQNGLMTDYGKEIADPLAESLDVAIIPEKLTSLFRHRIQEILERGQHDTWWESALADYSQSTPVGVQDVAGSFWREIDYIEDYKAICNFYCQTD